MFFLICFWSCSRDVVLSLSTTLCWCSVTVTEPVFLFLLKGLLGTTNFLQNHQNSNKRECKCKGLMSWPAIFLTLINNLGTTGTWCSSPSHIIHPTRSSAVLSLLSFGASRSLGSSLTSRSLVSFRTKRAWGWLVFARLACFSWKEKDLIEKACCLFSL